MCPQRHKKPWKKDLLQEYSQFPHWGNGWLSGDRSGIAYSGDKTQRACLATDGLKLSRNFEEVRGTKAPWKSLGERAPFDLGRQCDDLSFIMSQWTSPVCGCKYSDPIGPFTGKAQRNCKRLSFWLFHTASGVGCIWLQTYRHCETLTIMSFISWNPRS